MRLTFDVWVDVLGDVRLASDDARLGGRVEVRVRPRTTASDRLRAALRADAADRPGAADVRAATAVTDRRTLPTATTDPGGDR